VPLTNDSLDIFLCPISATFGFKRVSRPESERECFVVLSQKVVDLACQKGSRISSILRKVITLVQSFSELKNRLDTGWLECDKVDLYEHESN